MIEWVREWVCAIYLIREKLRFEKNKDDNILKAMLNKSDGQTNINKYRETVLLISSKFKQNIDDQPNFREAELLKIVTC